MRGECDKSVQKPYITLNWQTKEGYSCNFTMHFTKVEGETLKTSTEGRWAAANLTFSLKMNSSDAGMSMYPVSCCKQANTTIVLTTSMEPNFQLIINTIEMI